MINTMAKKPLKYGIIDPCYKSRFFMELANAGVWTNQSGKFAIRSSNVAALAASGSTELVGWAQVHAHTVASTGTFADIFNDANARFVIGVTGTYANTMRGKTCDLDTTTNIQTANVAASSTDVIVVYDGNATLALAEVGLNPLKMFVTGVA